MKLSKNGAGLVAMLLGFIGVNVSEGDLMTTISTIMQIAGGLITFYHQIAERKASKFVIFKDE